MNKKTAKPTTTTTAAKQATSKSRFKNAGSKNKSKNVASKKTSISNDVVTKKSKSSAPESSLPRLPDVCWHQIVSFALTDIVKQFDIVDDLQGANTLRNCTLVSQEWNAAMNNDLLWSLVWNDWKRQRNCRFKLFPEP